MADQEDGRPVWLWDGDPKTRPNDEVMWQIIEQIPEYAYDVTFTMVGEKQEDRDQKKSCLWGYCDDARALFTSAAIGGGDDIAALANEALDLLGEIQAWSDRNFYKESVNPNEIVSR